MTRIFKPMRQPHLRWPMHRKRHILMHFSDFLIQRLRRDGIAHLPTRRVKSLSKAKHRYRTGSQLGISQHGPMRRSVKHNVLIHLITQDDQVVALYQFFQLRHVRLTPSSTCGIVRIVDDDHSGLVRYLSANFVPINGKFRGPQGNVLGYPSRQLHCWSITIICGRKKDDLFPFSNKGGNRIEYGLRRPSGNRDFTIGSHFNSVVVLVLGTKGLAQGRQTRHWSILILSILKGLSYAI